MKKTAFFAIILLLMVSFSTSWLQAGSIASLTASEAEKMTQSLVDYYGQLHGVSTDKRMVSYLEGIAARVQVGTKLEGKLNVLLIESDEVNAFVSVEPTIFVFRGLLRFAKTREEIAGVFAHEMAHLQNKDVVAALEYAEQVAEETEDAGLQGIVGRLRSEVIGKHHQREMEFRADQYAADFLLAAGISPQGLPDFLERMSASIESSKQLGLGQRILSDLMSSHPSSKDRVKRLRDYIEESDVTPVSVTHDVDLSSRDDAKVLQKGISFEEALARFDERFKLPSVGTQWSTLEEMKSWPGGDRAGFRVEVPRTNFILRHLFPKAKTIEDLNELISRLRVFHNEEAELLAKHVARVAGLDGEKLGPAYATKLQQLMNSVDWAVIPDCPMDTGDLQTFSIAKYIDYNEDDLESVDEVKEHFALQKRMILEGGLLTHLIRCSGEINVDVARQVLQSVLLTCGPQYGEERKDTLKGKIILFDFISRAAKASGVTFLQAAAHALPRDGDFFERYRFLKKGGLRDDMNFDWFFLSKLVEVATTRGTVNPEWVLPSLEDFAAFVKGRKASKKASMDSLSTLLMFGLEMTTTARRKRYLESDDASMKMKLWLRSFFSCGYKKTVETYDELSPKETEGKHMEENNRYHDFQLLFSLGYLHPNMKGRMTVQALEDVKPRLVEKTKPLVDKVIAAKRSNDDEAESNALLELVAAHAESFINGGEIALMTDYFLDDAKKLEKFRALLESGSYGSIRRGDIDEAFNTMIGDIAGKSPVAALRRAAKDFDGTVPGLIRLMTVLPHDFQFVASQSKEGKRAHMADEHKDVRRLVEKALCTIVKTPEDCQALIAFYNNRMTETSYSSEKKRLSHKHDQALVRKILEKGVDLSMPEKATYDSARKVILEWADKFEAYSDPKGNNAKKISESIEKGLPPQLAFFDKRWAAEKLTRAFIRYGTPTDLGQLRRDIKGLEILDYAKVQQQDLAGMAGYYKIVEASDQFNSPQKRMELIERLIRHSSDMRDGLLSELLASELGQSLDASQRTKILSLIHSHDEAFRSGLTEYRKYEAKIAKDERNIDNLLEGLQRFLPQPSRERDKLIDEIAIRYAQSKEESDRAKSLKWEFVSPEERQDSRYMKENKLLLSPKTRNEFIRNTSPASIVALMLAFFSIENNGADSGFSGPEKAMVQYFKNLHPADREDLVDDLLVGFHDEMDQAEADAADTGLFGADNGGFSRKSAKQQFIDQIIAALFEVEDAETNFMTWLLSRDLHLLPKERSSKLIAALLRAKSEKVSMPVLVSLYLAHRGVVSRKAGQIFSTFESVPPEYREHLANLKSKVEVAFDKGEIIEIIREELPQVQLEKVGKKLGQASLRVVFLAQVKSEPCVVKVIHPDAPKLVLEDITIYDAMVSELDARPDLRKRFGIENPRGEFNQIILSLLEELDSAFEIGYSAELERTISEKNVSTSKVFAASRNVVIEELVRGMELFEGVRTFGLSGKDVATKLTKEFMSEIFTTGFFHADPHDGNIFVAEGGESFFLIDKGLMGRLPLALKDKFFKFLMMVGVADTTGKFEKGLVNSLLSLGYQAEKSFDRESLQKGLKKILDDENATMGQKLNSMFQEAKRHGFSFDRNFFLLTKALVTIEGVCRSLDDSYSLGPPLVKVMIRESLKRPFNWGKESWKELWKSRDKNNNAPLSVVVRLAWQSLAKGDKRDITTIIHEAAAAARGQSGRADVTEEGNANTSFTASRGDASLMEAVNRFAMVFELPEDLKSYLQERLATGGVKGGTVQGEKLFNELARLHLKLGTRVPFETRKLLLDAITTKELDVASHETNVSLIKLLDKVTERGLTLRILALREARDSSVKASSTLGQKSKLQVRLNKAVEEALQYCRETIGNHASHKVQNAFSILDRNGVAEAWLIETLPRHLLLEKKVGNVALEKACSTFSRHVKKREGHIRVAYESLRSSEIFSAMVSGALETAW